MKRRYRSILYVLVACLLAASLATPSFAADKTGTKKVQHNVTDTWLFWPNHGKYQAFEAGMKEHVAWRKSAGDPFEWDVYEPVVGRDLGSYAVLSGGHAWADMDTEDAWGQKTEAGKQFRQNVGVHVRKMQHFFMVTNEKLSHWIKDDGYRYFGVYTYHFKMGHITDIKDFLERVHKAVTRQSWPYGYRVRFTEGGPGGMTIVVPMKNWAGMADPSPSLLQVMTKATGSKQAARKMFDTFQMAIKDHNYTVWEYRPDLSTPR